ncbi:hypothetical protein GCM10025876_23920 [Demequina litorisediminis]|uniref:Uncharacterized protein n=1 Tax=Demequina litorisediminis TaxID=1849022 RepID=A0ABQ6IE93_9MICO|nr:hypothetical protein GCM10025876_23920 [Demequina litorisediminis]
MKYQMWVTGAARLDVAHTLATHARTGHLDATALTDDAAVADTLVLAAATLPVTGGAEDLLAEQAVLLGLERAVVDRLGLLHLAVRPVADLVRGRQADAQVTEFVHIEHSGSSSQISSTLEASGRLDREIPSDSAAWYASSSDSRISMT